MPFYLVNGSRVHIKFSGRGKPPAPCVAQVGLANGRRQCCDISGYLCDWQVSEGKTCDAPLCEAHAHQVGRNKHYCQRHRTEAEAVQPGLFTGLAALQETLP